MLTETETPTKTIAPFSANYSPQLPELLLNLKASIVISTYQAGKLVIISPKDENTLISLPRTFNKPMGFDVIDNQMVIACKDEVITLENNTELAKHYPNKKDTYDALFVPRTTFYTGQVDLHDIAFGKDAIWAINSSFSCLCKVNGQHNFTPVWKPKFITELVSEDRCHLNGMVLKNGTPRYVTALGTGNTHQSWRENIESGGVLIDLETDQLVLENLAMPHSPMLYNNELYMLLSATGELVKVNTKEKSYEVIYQTNGFCRGLDIYGDYAFIGMSKLRKNSSTFAKLPFAEKANQVGIKVIHLPTKAFVAEINYQTSVDEIYEVKILKNMIRPNVLNTINPIHKYSLSIPNQTFWANVEE